jgi:hypothetical protein
MIWISVRATPYKKSPDRAYVLCDIADMAETIDFAFTGVTIKVPLSQYIAFHHPQKGGKYCEFGIGKSPPGQTDILGYTTLSSIYAVFDLDNKQLHVAQAVSNATTSNILQIMAGPDGVPEQPGVPSLSTSEISTTSKEDTLSTSTPTRSSASALQRSTSSPLLAVLVVGRELMKWL